MRSLYIVGSKLINQLSALLPVSALLLLLVVEASQCSAVPHFRPNDYRGQPMRVLSTLQLMLGNSFQAPNDKAC